MCQRVTRVLFLFGGDHDDHSFAFEHGHLVYFAVVFEVVGKAEQEYFALFFEEDGAAFEEYIGFDLGAFGEESHGVLELEVVVVVVGLRPETDFFDYYFGGFGFDFFCFLFLLVEVLLVVEDFAHGWICLGRDFHQVEFEVFGYLTSLLNGVDAGGDVVTDQTDFAGADVLVDVVWVSGITVGQTAVALGLLLRARAGILGARAGGVVGFFLHSVGYWLIESLISLAKFSAKLAIFCEP